jgi:hypothetical protein
MSALMFWHIPGNVPGELNYACRDCVTTGMSLNLLPSHVFVAVRPRVHDSRDVCIVLHYISLDQKIDKRRHGPFKGAQSWALVTSRAIEARSNAMLSCMTVRLCQ